MRKLFGETRARRLRRAPPGVIPAPGAARMAAAGLLNGIVGSCRAAAAAAAPPAAASAAAPGPGKPRGLRRAPPPAAPGVNEKPCSGGRAAAAAATAGAAAAAAAAGAGDGGGGERGSRPTVALGRCGVHWWSGRRGCRCSAFPQVTIQV